MRWHIQDAERNFCELIHAAQSEGPQIVSGYDGEFVMVIDIAEYRQLADEMEEFEELLLSPPYIHRTLESP